MTRNAVRFDKRPRRSSEDDVRPPRSGPYAHSFDDRRRRILRTAWALVAENQGQEFSLLHLSQLADVSLRTIYNAFGDKNGVIEAAIGAHYDSIFESEVHAAAHSCTLQEGLRITTDVAKEICRVRGWSRTAAQLFFSPHCSSSMKGTLTSMPLRIANAWLKSSEVDAECAAAVGVDVLGSDYAYAQWGIVNDWGLGLLSDRELDRKMCMGLIILALAVGNASGRAEAKRLAHAIRAREPRDA